jgi:hypothetical protein
MALRNFPKRSETVLDIDAHVGISVSQHALRFCTAIIHSYEPSPNLEQYLKVNACVENSRYFVEAVDLHDGKVALDLHEDSVRARSRRDEVGEVTAVSSRKAIERLGLHVDFSKWITKVPSGDSGRIKRHRDLSSTSLWSTILA